MGLLSAALQGAGQGLNVIGQGMLKDIDRQQDQSIWEKRQALLAEIQRESAKNMRVDARDFSVDPATLAANDTVATAAGKTAANVELATLGNDDLQGKRREVAAANTASTAAASAEASRDATKAAGGDKAYITALKTITAAGQAPDRTDYKGRELDNALKQMTVDNAKRGDSLRAEFGKATPERQKAIKDELAIITGKDGDKFLPVPLKDDMGNVTGYKVFDTKAGTWVEDGKGAGDPIKAAMDAARAARDKDKPAAKAEAKPSEKPAGGGMLSSLTAPDPRKAGAITEDPPRRGNPGGFIFAGKTYPTMEAAKAARGY